MASKDTDARPAQLSEEYVQDSSDEGETGAEDVSKRSGLAKGSGRESPPKQPSSNGVAPAPEQQDTPAPESPQSSQESGSSSDEGNKSDGVQSNASNGSKKRTGESETMTESSRSSKKQKKRYAKAGPCQELFSFFCTGKRRRQYRYQANHSLHQQYSEPSFQMLQTTPQRRPVFSQI